MLQMKRTLIITHSKYMSEKNKLPIHGIVIIGVIFAAYHKALLRINI